jgi:hypothetical protein
MGREKIMIEEEKNKLRSIMLGLDIDQEHMKDFEKLTFHRKIDVLVAIYVMGFSYNSITIKEMKWNDTRLYWSVYRAVRPGLYTDIPLYSTLLTSAWDLVRKFDFCYLFRSTDFKGGQWECKLIDKHDNLNGEVYYAWEETEMLAICYAGLKVVEYPLKDFLKEEGKI